MNQFACALRDKWKLRRQLGEKKKKKKQEMLLAHLCACSVLPKLPTRLLARVHRMQSVPVARRLVQLETEQPNKLDRIASL